MANIPFTPSAPSVPSRGVAITKSDSTVYNPPLTGIYVGTTGDLVVCMAGQDSPITFKDVPAGQFLSICVRQVMAATGAADLVGVW